MGAQTQFDISARITGYQSTLKQLQQAIQQLDPGASIRKSLQAAFKNAEAYINKLAKNPIVNVGSEKQLQGLINTLDKASSMISGIANRFKEVDFSDLNAEVLKEALDGINQQLSETTQKLNQVSNGPQLSTLAGKVKNLDTVFSGLGKNINDLGAIEGVNVLNEALEESKSRAEEARAALEDVQKRINAWKPPEDTTGLFGSKSGGKGTKLLKQLDTSSVFKNIDFDKAGFSQQAIEKLKINLTEQLKASLDSNYLKEGVAENIQTALDTAFNQGLNAGNLSDRIGQFADNIRAMLGKKASEMGDIYNMIFGGDVGSKKSGTRVADNLLRQVTIEMNAGAERLRQIIEIVSNAKLAEDKPLIKLVEAGQFENVKQQLEDILQTAKQAYVEMRQLPSGLSEERTNAQARLAAANSDINNIGTVQQQIINTQEYQQAIAKIQQLETEVAELRTALSELQAQKVSTIHEMADDVDKAGQSYRITTEQAEQYRNKLDEIQSKEKLLGKIQGVVERWFSIYAAVRLVSNAVRSMISTVEELDKTITNIAIVTSMSQNDLWQQMPVYTKTAREFAASISGVYEVSQLYYQQGLQTVDVMKLTEETLKMARISGLDYAESTDYMTNALRSFKMEMQDAGRIVDVYSAIAAKTATDVEELAQAMSKTASSAEAVGSSFENTTAMMAVMIEATRQAPENIGSAMKSIISRYGQLKVNPNTLVDSEGQALSLNKVDTALQSVGISIHDAQGQFRDFDDVIMDLAKSWDTIDKNTQRYIATVMAGNRQQSRFLALVSSYERLKETAEIAANSQNAAQLQYLKTLDSIKAKQQQLQTSMQSLYTSTGIQNFYKGLIDLANGIVKSFTDMPTIFSLPIPAILKFGTTFYSLARIVTTVLNSIKNEFVAQQQQINVVLVQGIRQEGQRQIDITRATQQEKLRIRQEAAQKARMIQEGMAIGSTGLTKEQKASYGKWSKIASLVGIAGTMLSAAPQASNEVKAVGSIIGGMGNFAGIGMALGSAIPGIGTVAGGIGGAIIGALSGLPEAIDLIVETAEEKVERFNQQITDANNKKLISENEFKTLTDYQKRMDSLNESAKEGNDVKAQQVALNAEIAASYPELIKGIDEQGNIIVDLTNKYKELKKNKQAAYAKDIIESGKQQLTAASDTDWIWKQLGLSQQQVNKSNDTTTNLAGSILNNSKVADYMAQVSSLNATKETKGRDILSILGYNKEQNYLDIDTNIKQIIDKLKSADMLVDDIYADNGQVMVRYFAEALYEYLSSHPDQTVGKVIDSLQQSNASSQLVNQSQKINTYKENFIQGIITSSIAQLRQSYDAIFDQNNKVTGLAGIYMNKSLQNSFTNYRASNSDSVDKQWQDWSNNKFDQVYQSAYQIITDEGQSKLFQQLQKYYDDLDNITTKEINQLTFNWGTKDNKGAYYNKAFETFINQYNAIKNDIDKQFKEVTTDLFGTYQNFTIGFKKRVLALSQTADLNYFLNSYQDNDESEVSEALSILEQNSLDTIAGLETALAKYVKSKGLEVGSNQYKADPFIQAIQEMQANLKINFNTQYETLTESYTKSLKEFDKAIKNATSGMDFEDAVKLAGQLNKSLADFTFKDGKFFFNNIEAIKQQFVGNDGLKAALQKQVEAAEVIFQNGQILQKYTQEYTQDAWEQVDDDVEKYYSSVQAFIKNNQYTHDQAGWKKYIADLQKNLNQLDQASSYVARSAYITSGDIDKFIKSFKDSQGNLEYQYIDSDELRAQLFEGTISPDFEKYKQQLFEYYRKGAQSVYDTAVKMLSGEESIASIAVTDANKQLLATLKSYETVPSSWTTDGSTIIDVTYEEVIQNFNAVMSNALTQQGIGWKARIDNAAKIWNSRFDNNSYDSISSAIKSFQEIDFTTWATLPSDLRALADLNTVTGKFVLNINEAAKIINTDYLKNLGWNNKQINELQATIRKSQRENDIKTIASDIVKNRESLTEENIASIATALGQTYDDVIATLQLQRNQDGTYRMNMNSILQLMNQKKGQLDTVLAQMIAEEIDNIIGNVSNIASNQGKGVTSYAEMQKAASRAQQAGFDVDISDLYRWNDTIHGFVLSAEGILVEVARAQMEFESLSAENKEARQLLQDQIESMGRQLANSIDINAFMQAENKNPGSEAAKTLIKGIDDYNNYLRAIGQTTLLNATAISNNLRAGGIDAVNTIKEIAKLQGREVTSDEISAAYRQSAERLLAASQELTAGVGEIVSDEAAFLINLSKGETQKLANGANLVTRTARDLYIAFNQLYGELEASGAATLEELNNLAAEYYNERQGAKKGQLLDMLSNSAEMTYNQLAEMFTAAGWKFTTDTIDQLGNNISKLNNGRVRINNFKGFADALGINTNSPEYLEAFKSYNDALIKESQFVEKTINDELNNLVKAKPGDLINISGLYTKVGDMLEVELMTAGVQFNDGIVKITEATNLPALIQSIESAAASQGLILESDVQALIDAVQALFKGLADSITKGIQGTLSKTEAMDLQSSARNLIPGFNEELKFTQTYNGLKLSTDQAIKLYDAMKGVDAVSSHIVFDSLTKQLTKAGEACESMSRAMAEIARLEDKVKQSTGDARKEAEKQLAVYKQIANTQIQNPESYDWMNRDLPDYLKGPENYWNSLGTAFKALNEAAKEAEEGSTKAAHMLDPTDFYNMVNEFNNIAQLSGTKINFLGHQINGDMTVAAKLIQQGMRTLSNVDGDGVKVDLTKFGANFTGGAEGMAKGVHEGIRAMAKSQIEMLDGMIQLLETVVAMQQLGDITNGDGQIDLNDLFPDITGEDGYKLKAGKITEWANSLLGADKESDLGKALDSVKFGTKTLRELLAGATSDVGLAKDDAIALQKAMDALWQMYQSGDYSLQNLIGSIQQVLAGSGYEGQVDIGTTSFYVKGDYILQKGKDGWEVPGVGSFEDENQALKAYMLKEKTGVTNISFTEEGQAFAPLTIGDQQITVQTTVTGVKYNVNGRECDNYNEAARQAYNIYLTQAQERERSGSGEDILIYDEWRMQNNVRLESSVNITNEDQVKQKVASATHEQVAALSQALASGNAGKIAQAVVPFGIEYKPVDEDASALQSDINRIANLANIDTKTLALSLATEVVGDNAENVKKILANQHLSATVDLTGNLTNLDGTQNTLTYDEQVSVTLANIKAMATAESINWDGITALINTVPEDKRPTVEAQAKQYIIKALEGNPEYQGFPALLTGLQGLPIPALQATATVMSILWGGGANVTNATGLTQDQINALAATLDLPDTMLEALATLVQITDGGVVPEESAELATKLSQLFPDGKYTTNDIKAITLAATAAAVMINGKGVTATGEFDDSYQTTNGIAQVTADIIKLIVSTNASTTTEEGTTFNADNWQGTVDKIYAVAALLEVGLQNEADINVDGTNIPSNVATTKTIEALRASAAVLSVIFQKDPTGKNINVEEVDKVIAELEKQEKIQASDIDSIKAIVASILFKPKDDNMKPQGLDTLIPKDTDGAYNAGKLTVKYQTEVEFTDSAEEAYKALRDQLYTLSQGTNAGLYETWGNTSFVNSQTGVTTFLDQLLDKVVNKGHILTRAEQNILNNYKTAIEAAPEELANNFKQINMKIDALIDENDLNISNQQEQFSILSQTFSQLDSTKLQECATAMSELAESAQKVKDVPWQELVNGVNNINNIETPNEDLATASTIMRTIQASLSVVAATGDTVAAEIISPEPLQRTIQLLADTTALDEALKKIRQSPITIDLNQNEQEQNAVQAPTNNNAQQGIKTPDTDGINDLIKAAENAVTQAIGLFDNVNQALAALQSSSTKSETTVNNLSESIREIPSGYDRYVSWLADAMYDIPNVAWVIRDLNAQLQALGSDPIQIVLEVSGEAGAKGTANTIPFSYGHPAYLTFAKGNALAQGKVLMGELGPELVVSNGKFFVVGQAGAQMVDLAPDAIVFNHLQTKRLLSSGHAGRGKPVTNERTAVSRAKGSGNALASASSALAALKQIRAMWQSMLNASMKDLGSLAGQEAGKVASGSGGSSSDPNRPASIGAVIEEIERWYNLLRQIDKLEKDITYQQNLQAKIASDRIANGKAMYTSYRQEIEYLDQQIERNQQLADLQKSWYERKRQELVDSDYGKIFTYDENGQLQYRHGTNLGLDVLEKLTRRDIYGKTSGASTNARTQINYLRQIGFKVDKLRYNDDGSVIKPEDYEDNPDQMYVDMMQNYWDRLDSWKEELDGIYDSYTDQLNNIVTNETKRNQILQKIVDNQLSVEQDVVHAIESREQKLIDQLSDEREALEKSNKDFIDGLTDQLNQQREMYKNNENEKDLVKLRRQIAILQRSGGSASAINSLQSQLASKEQDQYFTMQQQQISAIQQASDLQLERMDAQIDLMTETLEYQKEHGLLWEEVYQVMAGTPEQIRQFIVENTPDFESASALDVAEKIRDIDLRINEWVGYRDDQTVDMTSTTATGKVIKGSVGYTDWNSYLTSQDNRYADRASDILKERARQKFEQVLSETGDLRKAGEAADAIFKEVLGDSAGIYHEYQNIPEKQTTPEDTHKPTETVPEHNYNNYYRNDDYNYNRNNNTNKNTSSTSSSDKKTFVFKSYNETQMNDLKSQIMNASSRSEQQPLIKKYNQLYDSLPQHRKKLYHRYKSGGLVDYTGLAQVDGTPSRPEAFINAEQTQLLRKYLFGDSNASLLSLAQSIAQQLHGISYISDTNYQEEDSHVNIENVDVNVNIKQVANDYDVRAMGATVMDEILNIARKSGTRSLSRR